MGVHQRAGDAVPCGAWGQDRKDDCADDLPWQSETPVAVASYDVGGEPLDEQCLSTWCRSPIRVADGHRPFYTYYQIGGTDESDETENEPKKEGELRTEHEGSHSLFGFVWQIADATGWSVRYILSGVNYQTLIMMLSDAPRYVRRRVKKTESEATAEDEANAVAGFFRSQLK